MNSFFDRLKKNLLHFSSYYFLDLRALSLMRIGVALIVLCDLIIRAQDLSALYTNAGIWPLHILKNFGWQPGFWSLHCLYGSYAWEVLLFSLHGVFALFLLFGYQTKLSTLFVWLLTISLQNRNIFILQAGDDQLRLILFWGLFLPWNACYAIDSRHTQQKKISLIGNFGYLFLIASVYAFTVLLKTDKEWTSEGSAIYYALSLDQIKLPLGDLLYRFPSLMKTLTYLVFIIESIVPILILWPSKKGKLRLTAFCLLLLLHLSIGLTMYVGLFFIISSVSAIGLIPSLAMDWIEKKFRLKSKEHSAETTEQSWYTPFTASFGTLVILLCLLLNLSTVPWFNYELKSELNYPVNALRLNQFWGMFSPGILKTDGWFVYHGMDSIGRQWDLRLNQDYVDYKKPAHIVSMYRNDRWRKLAENMQRDKYTFLRPLYGRYYLHQWNLHHPEKQIPSMNLYFMEKENLSDYKSTKPKKILLCVSYDN